MKLLKLTLVFTASISILGSGTVAFASHAFTLTSGAFVGDGTSDDVYTFSRGSSPLNGSSIAINDDNGVCVVVGWDLLDNNASAIGNTVELSSMVSAAASTYDGTALTMGPGLSFSSVSNASALGFQGSYSISNYFGPGVYPPATYASFATFSGTGRYLSDEIVTYNGNLGAFTDVIDDPDSPWVFAGSFSVPDEANTFALLLAGGVALAVFSHRIRVRKPTFVLTASIALLCSGPAALAGPGSFNLTSPSFDSTGASDDVYTFTEAGSTLTGSSIAINDNNGTCTLVGWDLLDNNSAVIGNTVEIASLVSPGASSYNGTALVMGGGNGGGSISSASALGFSGSYYISNYFGPGVYPPATYAAYAAFSGTGASLSDEVVTFNGNGGPFTDAVDDPQSPWTFAGSFSVSSVPDEADTFALLLAGGSAIIVYSRRLRARLG